MALELNRITLHLLFVVAVRVMTVLVMAHLVEVLNVVEVAHLLEVLHLVEVAHLLEVLHLVVVAQNSHHVLLNEVVTGPSVAEEELNYIVHTLALVHTLVLVHTLACLVLDYHLSLQTELFFLVEQEG